MSGQTGQPSTMTCDQQGSVQSTQVFHILRHTGNHSETPQLLANMARTGTVRFWVTDATELAKRVHSRVSILEVHLILTSLGPVHC